MSDDAPSPEATVAGEAAAAAVDELHAREQVVETAETAAILASDASSEAVLASESAAIAQSIAADSFELSQSAAGQAQEAAETAATTAYLTADAFDAHRTETDEKLRQMREYIDSRIPLPTPEPAREFEEVEADDAGTASGTGTEIRNSGGSQAGAETGGKVESSEESSGEDGPKSRYGLRHRRR